LFSFSPFIHIMDFVFTPNNPRTQNCNTAPWYGICPVACFVWQQPPHTASNKGDKLDFSTESTLNSHGQHFQGDGSKLKPTAIHLQYPPWNCFLCRLVVLRNFKYRDIKPAPSITADSTWRCSTWRPLPSLLTPLGQNHVKYIHGRPDTPQLYESAIIKFSTTWNTVLNRIFSWIYKYSTRKQSQLNIHYT